MPFAVSETVIELIAASIQSCHGIIPEEMMVAIQTKINATIQETSCVGIRSHNPLRKDVMTEVDITNPEKVANLSHVNSSSVILCPPVNSQRLLGKGDGQVP